jgi:hypothetical protein
MRAIGIAFVAVIVSMSTAAAPQTAAPVAPAPSAAQTPPAPLAAPAPPSKCIYNNAVYTQGAAICIGLHYGQSCDINDTWKELSKDAGFSDACANAQPTSPGAPEPPLIPAKCTYHDVSYTSGAVICIGPSSGQICSPNGSWIDFGNKKLSFAEVCKDAQIPSPTGGSTTTGATQNKP